LIRSLYLKPEKSARQDQNRDAAARRRERRKHARVVLRIVASGSGSKRSKNRLSRSIYRGYRADVCEAIETFLMALGT
jgi:hypothetical protein